MTKKIPDNIIVKLNPFSDIISPMNLRACVGNNSGISEHSRDCSIIDGYKESVKFLMKHIEDRSATIDIAVYPLLFCCRHSVELSLKVLIKNLIIIYKRKHKIYTTDDYIAKVEVILKTHDIKELTSALKNFKILDREIDEVLKELKYLDDCIKDYFFDINGDSFRYTYKRNHADINLENIGLIDLGVFYRKYNLLMSEFNYLINYFSAWLGKQYYKNSYTKNLNKLQIEEISQKLPDISIWTTEEFDKIKSQICSDYKISNSEFSKAVNIIKKHYSFSMNIGIENKFQNIQEDTFIKIGELIKAHKNKNRPEPTNGFYIYNISEADKYSYFDKSFDIAGLKLFSNIPKDDKLALISFYEFSCSFIDGNYECEDLDDIYNSWRKRSLDDNYSLHKTCGNVISGKFRNSLEKCGQKTYLEWFDKYIGNDF